MSEKGIDKSLLQIAAVQSGSFVLEDCQAILCKDLKKTTGKVNNLLHSKENFFIMK